jgi:exopolysaccharide biosynthesis polyprenyl glycosylphosphotransferase
MAGDQLDAGMAGRRRWELRYARGLVAYDAVAAMVAALVAYLVRFSDNERPYLVVSLAAPLVWLVSLALAGTYEPRVLGLGSEEFQRVFRAFIGLTAAVGFFSYAVKAEIARGYIVLALPLVALLSLLGHYLARKALHRQRQRGVNVHRVVAVGGEQSVVELITRLRQERHCGMQVVGACIASGDGLQVVRLGVPLLGGVDDVATAIDEAQADMVAVAACAEIDPTRLRRLAWQLESRDTDLVVAPGLMEVAGPRLHIRPVTGLPLVHVEKPEFAGAGRVIKGVTDRVLALLGLVLLAPLMVAIALAVKLSGPGPVLFRQVRVGKDGREFTLLKFRSMGLDAEQRREELLGRNERAEGLLFKIRDDPRVTRVGRVLRKYSLDELPQLVNVLAGTMALVGPRPPLPAEVALYGDDVRRRLLVKPGLTGLWQISGRSDLTWDESVRLDLRYVENWSLALDLMILWKTASALRSGHGAY